MHKKTRALSIRRREGEAEDKKEKGEGEAEAEDKKENIKEREFAKKVSKKNLK